MDLNRISVQKQRNFITNVDTLPEKIKLKTTRVKHNVSCTNSDDRCVAKNSGLDHLDNTSWKENTSAMPGKLAQNSLFINNIITI